MEENGKLVSFIFREREVVLEESQEDKVRYIRTNVLLTSDAESARTYYHYASDEMGSITHVVDREAEEILNQYEYDVWGNPTVCEEKVPNRFKFNGQQYDLVSQQYYLRARYYNPVIERFTQEDTYHGDGLNLYAYCANNPVYYVDSNGHDASQNIENAFKKSATVNEGRKEKFPEINPNNPFYKKDGGSNLDDFITIHARKHAYDPTKTSTANKTLFGKNVDVAILCNDTIQYPDKVKYDQDQQMHI